MLLRMVCDDERGSRLGRIDQTRDRSTYIPSRVKPCEAKGELRADNDDEIRFLSFATKSRKTEKKINTLFRATPIKPSIYDI